MHRFTRLLATTVGAALLGAALTVATTAPAAASPGGPSCVGVNTTDLTVIGSKSGSSTTSIENCDPSFTGSTIKLDLHFTAGSDMSALDIALLAPAGTGYHPVACSLSCTPIGLNYTIRLYLASNELRSGTWTLTVANRSFFGNATLDSWQVAVDLTKPPTGCYGTNGSDVATGSFVATSMIPIACNGKAAANTTVEVHLNQPSLSAFLVYLVAENNDKYLLKPADDERDAMNTVYTVDVSSEGAYQHWRLQIVPSPYYVPPFPAGVLDSWSLNVAPVGPATAYTASNNTAQTIWSTGQVSSPITVSGVGGNASNHSTVRVRITPTNDVDYLSFYLIAPDGTRYLLGNAPYDHTAPIDETYPVNPSLELRNGTWKLLVSPSGSSGNYAYGTLQGWTLTV
ncbi:proprotein convertase P-domain-containing protein [Dactylosporangium salmoneum]|uniref:P/Homo B domain-containing protein n=1 Tax=Dactylosporangium salmoneum TaxID=53361 RepID=A0ABN3FKT5_9ACTN